MKNLIFLFAIACSMSAQAQLSRYCQTMNNNPNAEFCSHMRHLRATINVFDQQREMALVNYNYLGLMGQSLRDNAGQVVHLVPTELSDHKFALESISKLGEEIIELSKTKNPDLFVTTNQVSSQCLSCHNSTNPRAGGLGWNEVFRIDWRYIPQECNQVGRNPFLCRSMNSMATSYNHLSTASAANIQNYEVTEGVATEVVRILGTLGENNFLHGVAGLRMAAEARAKEIVQLAKDKNPIVFSKSVALVDACNTCHVTTPASQANLKLKIW